MGRIEATNRGAILRGIRKGRDRTEAVKGRLISLRLMMKEARFPWRLNVQT